MKLTLKQWNKVIEVLSKEEKSLRKGADIAGKQILERDEYEVVALKRIKTSLENQALEIKEIIKALENQ